MERSPHKDSAGNRMWLCSCVCGHRSHIKSLTLRSGKSKSCNHCAQRKHGHAGATTKAYSPTYMTWQSMLQRVSRPSYVRKNIQVCDRWKDYVNFLEDMGVRPKGMTLDRMDNLKGYCKDNCRWASKKQQANNRETNKMLELNGETKSLQEWADAFNVHEATVQNRLKKNWSLNDALTTPTTAIDDLDQVILENKVSYILGVDEVATGSCAGPIFVAGVLLKVGDITGAKDSKKYATAKIVGAAEKLGKYRHHIAVGTVDSIHADGHQPTVYRCFLVVVQELYKYVPGDAVCVVVIDGKNHIPAYSGLQVALPKADALVSAVSTASVLAKAMQLTWANLAHQEYPNHAFDQHHGYATEAHKKCMDKFGLTKWHRINVAPVRERKIREEVSQ